MLVGTGQLIEQRRFAAVLIAGKRKGQFFTGSRGFGVLINVVVLGFPELAHAGVRRRTVAYLSGGRLFCSLIRCADFDLPRFIQAQGQFIAAQLKLHRIPHRSDLLQRDLGLRRQSHIEQVMAQGSASAYCGDFCTFMRFQFIQCHIYISSRLRAVDSFALYS